MRRFLRILLNVATVVSLLLCMTTAVAWVWSYVRPTQPTLLAAPPSSAATYTGWGLAGGHVAVWNSEVAAPGPHVPGGYPYGAEVGGWSAAGLRWRRERLTIVRPQDRAVVATVSSSATLSVWLGLPLLLSSVLPAYSLLRYLKVRRREKRAGTCPACGYNLHGNVSGVCPECGTPTTVTA